MQKSLTKYKQIEFMAHCRQGWSRAASLFENQLIHHINMLKKKNNMIISVDEEKAFDKIQDPFII